LFPRVDHPRIASRLVEPLRIEGWQSLNRALVEAQVRIDDIAVQIIVMVQGLGIAQHHDGVACGAHQVVAFLHNAAVFAGLKAEKFKLEFIVDGPSIRDQNPAHFR
jgi:hypothetical protein